MTVLIESLQGQKISKLISAGEQLMLDTRSAEILEFCQEMSAESWSGYVDGKLICCWGLIPPSILSNQAYLWIHSTPAVREHRFLLVRHSQRVVENALLRYEIIVGHCRCSAVDSIRWLKWLGATFDSIDADFRPFVIRRK